MTKDEIKQLIAEKIAGQGSAIDAASVLPTILDAIIDAIPNPTEIIEITPSFGSHSFDTIEEMAEGLGISVEKLRFIMTGNCILLAEHNKIFPIYFYNNTSALYGGFDRNENGGASIYMKVAETSGGEFEYSFIEI